MRTTITLDPDVERLLKDAMSENDLSFKEAVNSALRRGLRPDGGQPRKPFVQRSFDCGPLLVGPDTNFNHLAAELEDQEILAKLAQGR
jgi:hypothetical protein